MRNRTLIGSFLLLVVLLLLVIFSGRSPFGKDNSSFGSEPKEEITRIEFTDGKQELYLEKSNDNWLVNGNSEARRTAVLFIEKIVRGIKIKSPLSSDLFDSVIISSGIVPVKVKVFEKRQLLNSFLVYKTSTNMYGNVMKKKDRAKPFITYLPGYDGDIGSAFSLNELFWLPYTVFNLLPSEISYVNFEHLADSASSFSITDRNRNFILTAGSREINGWDSSLVTRYISYFTRIPFESWVFESVENTNVTSATHSPLYRLTVTTTLGEKIILTMWEKTDPVTGEKDTDRLYGKTQSRDEFFIMRYYDIDPIIKKRSYFFPN